MHLVSNLWKMIQKLIMFFFLVEALQSCVCIATGKYVSLSDQQLIDCTSTVSDFFLYFSIHFVLQKLGL